MLCCNIWAMRDMVPSSPESVTDGFTLQMVGVRLNMDRGLLCASVPGQVVRHHKGPCNCHAHDDAILQKTQRHKRERPSNTHPNAGNNGRRHSAQLAQCQCSNEIVLLDTPVSIPRNNIMVCADVTNGETTWAPSIHTLRAPSDVVSYV